MTRKWQRGRTAVLFYFDLGLRSIAGFVNLEPMLSGRGTGVCCRGAALFQFCCSKRARQPTYWTATSRVLRQPILTCFYISAAMFREPNFQNAPVWAFGRCKTARPKSPTSFGTYTKAILSLCMGPG